MRRVVPALACLALNLAPFAAGSEEIVAGLSQNRISITANFDGSEIFIYGAVKRDEPVPEGARLEAIITVEGPSSPVMVRRKTKRYGIWVNTQALEVDLAPSFYAVATTAPLADILSQTEDLRSSISIPRAIRSVGAPMDIQDAESFSEALIRIRTAEGHYALAEGAVALRESTLFSARIALPANLVEGNYKTRILLTRGGQVVDSYEALILVRKVGLERWLYTLSQNRPFIYGMLSLVIAAVAGWAASAAARKILR